MRKIVKIVSAGKTPWFKLFDATLQCFQTSIGMSHIIITIIIIIIIILS